MRPPFPWALINTTRYTSKYKLVSGWIYQVQRYNSICYQSEQQQDVVSRHAAGGPSSKHTQRRVKYGRDNTHNYGRWQWQLRSYVRNTFYICESSHRSLFVVPHSIDKSHDGG